MSVAPCAELVERGDPDRFLAAMAAPPEARARLFPLYAFNLEIARAPWLTAEPLIAEMRLQFWRDVLGEISAGRGPRAHEVADPLHRLHREVALPLDALTRMIDARRSDIAREPFGAADALWGYLDDSAGSLMWASVAALGGEDERGARRLGRAAGLAAWLEAQPGLAARGWRTGDPALLPALIERALDDLAALPPRGFGPATPAARAAWRAQGVLRRAKTDPAAIAEGRLGSSEFARRGGLLWRSLRGRW